MEDSFVPTEGQKKVLQVLNSVDAVILAFILAFAGHNFVRYVCRGMIRRCFIISFYLLVLFCLVSWLITSVAQAYDPDTRYLVFQKIDDPKFYHVISDMSQAAFLALFMLVSATMFHLSQSLKLILPHIYQLNAMKAHRSIVCYNAFCAVLVVLYIGMLVFIFFFRDIEAELVLSLNLSMRVIMLAVYLFTVIGLLGTLKTFPKEAM